MKRSELIVAQNRTFPRARLPAGSLGVEMDKGIQFRLQRLDAFKLEFNDFDGRDFLGSDFLCDFRYGAVGREAHGLLRESKRTCDVGQASGERRERRNSGRVKTVDHVNDSRENSNCARMGRIWNSGIPRGQEETFSCAQISGV